MVANNRGVKPGGMKSELVETILGLVQTELPRWGRRPDKTLWWPWRRVRCPDRWASCWARARRSTVVGTHSLSSVNGNQSIDYLFFLHLADERCGGLFRDLCSATNFSGEGNAFSHCLHANGTFWWPAERVSDRSILATARPLPCDRYDRLVSVCLFSFFSQPLLFCSPDERRSFVERDTRDVAIDDVIIPARRFFFSFSPSPLSFSVCCFFCVLLFFYSLSLRFLPVTQRPETPLETR